MEAAQTMVRDNGILTIGENASFGTFIKIVSSKSITIKNNLLASLECLFFDTDFHFMINTINHEFRNNCKLVIGENCWIGNRTSILKGTILPDHCIVGSNSLCNKDYKSIVKENSVIQGSPAKLIKENISSINSKSAENKLNRIFWNSIGEKTSILFEDLNT
jgi:acetyltransferase-like isoleucine patch superfamily enzyme